MTDPQPDPDRMFDAALVITATAHAVHPDGAELPPAAEIAEPQAAASNEENSAR